MRLKWLNVTSPLEHYQMPIPEQLWERGDDCSVFSKIDMKSGFHEIEVAECDQPPRALSDAYSRAVVEAGRRLFCFF